MKFAQAMIVALMLCLGVSAFADVAVPPLTGRVVDQTGTLGADQAAALETTLKDFEARKGSQIAVLIVPTTAPETIEQFTIRVAEAWKIGRKKIDDGVLVVVAKDDRTLRIEVGYGLEGALTDLTSRRIISEIMVPKFRAGDYSGGVIAGVNSIIKVVDGEPLPAPAPARRQQDSGLFDQIDPFNPFLIIGVLVLGGMMRGIFGRLLGSVATGSLVAVVVWFIAGALAVSVLSGGIAFVFTLISESVFRGFAQGGGSGGRRGGGISGGFGGSSSSSSGGFSGGGGSFGGGGASGSW